MVEEHISNEETNEADSVTGVPQEDAGKPTDEIEVQNKEDSKKPSDGKDPKNNTTRLPPTKRKKLSNFEKGVSLICSTLNETSKRDMERYESLLHFYINIQIRTVYKKKMDCMYSSTIKIENINLYLYFSFL